MALTEAASKEDVHNAPLFQTHEVWLGAMVPKRWAKRAVTRNAIKRQIYSVSAQFVPQLRPRGYVVRLRAGFEIGRAHV